MYDVNRTIGLYTKAVHEFHNALERRQDSRRNGASIRTTTRFESNKFLWSHRVPSLFLPLFIHIDASVFISRFIPLPVQIYCWALRKKKTGPPTRLYITPSSSP